MTQLDYNPELPADRDDGLSPWPTWPLVMRTSSSHVEGGQRRYQVAVQRFRGDSAGHVTHLVLAEVEVRRDGAGDRKIVPVGDEFEIPCDMALFAIGFEGVESSALLTDLGVDLSRRRTVPCGSDWETAAEGVFVCGDAHRGASLVVWAIAEGRAAARAVDVFLMGASDLPAPVHPGALPLSVR